MTRYKVYLQAFWRGADYEDFVSTTLGDRFVLTSDMDAADVVLTSVFGPATVREDKINVQLSWESSRREEKFDLSFLSEQPEDETQVWCPLLLQSVPGDYRPSSQRLGFASCIVSNTRFTDGAVFRLQFMRALADRFSGFDVRIGGSNPLANVYVPRGDIAKLEWMRENPCVFNICLENNVKNGYITEKIRDAYLTRHIPVYLGGTEGYEDYVPEGSYVKVNPDDFESTFRQMEEVFLDKKRQEEILSKAPVKYDVTAQTIIREGILKLLESRGM